MSWEEVQMFLVNIFAPKSKIFENQGQMLNYNTKLVEPTLPVQNHH